MTSWIRFRFENGDTTMVNAEEAHFVFRVEDRQIEVHAMAATLEREGVGRPICVFPCEYSDQVAAAEELIFDAVSKGESITVNLDVLEEHAEFLNHVTGVRMVLQLLHQGNIRIPLEEGLTDGEMFDLDDTQQRSEISQFEEMLNTYLEVPDDSLRRALDNGGMDAPFELSKDHEECEDHGYHQYWIVATRPDRNYTFRKKFDDLVKSLIEKEGLTWQEPAHGRG
ncbi:MAG: hypothetical protein V3S29_06910 [bacterium]